MINNSVPCCKSELDLFATYPSNLQILEKKIFSYEPGSNSDKEVGESFQISIGSTEDYINLSETRLYFKVQLIKISKDNTGKIQRVGVVTKDDKVGVINNFAQSIFKQIEVIFGDGLDSKITETNKNYAYKSYLINLLNYGDDSKNNWMECGLFAKDDSGEFDNFKISNQESIKQQDNSFKTISLTANNGFLKRRNYFLESNGIVEMIIPLHCDIFQCDRLLKDFINIRLKFTRNKDEFLLKGDDADKFKLIVSNMELFVTKCLINNEVKNALINTLQTNDMKYPIKNININDYQINKDLISFKSKNNVSTVLPNIIIIGLVENEAFQGSFKSNPFNFKTFNLKSIDLIIDDKAFNIKLDYDSNSYIQAYEKLMNGLNIFGIRGNSVSRKDFANGNSLYFFDLRPIKSCNGEHNLIKSAIINIQLEFKTKTQNIINMIVLEEYENQLNIDKKSKVFYDIAL